jgi:glycosyltransferase involved in cell wall biosynthesis
VLAWNGGGECESEILALIQELNLEQITEIRGNSNISQLYEEAHVVVIPRIYKKGLKQNMFFPLRIIEALVFRKPMIISDIYEWGSIIRGCGLAVRPGNVEDLRDAIIKMITDKDFYDSCVNECPFKLKKYHPDISFSVMYDVFQNDAMN